MNILELNAQAEGILTYLEAKTESPSDGLVVLAIALCMIYDKCVDHSTCSFNKFAGDFHMSLLKTEASKSTRGPEAMQ